MAIILSHARKVIVDVNGAELEWSIYDFGPRDVRCPLFCLPPVSGTGDAFFNQIMGLCCAGFRVISVLDDMILFFSALPTDYLVH